MRSPIFKRCALETETNTEKPQNKPKSQPARAAAKVVSLKPETTSALQSTIVDLLTAERQGTLDSSVIIFKKVGS